MTPPLPKVPTDRLWTALHMHETGAKPGTNPVFTTRPARITAAAVVRKLATTQAARRSLNT